MAEFDLIETRKISGVGILQVPTDKVANRMSILYLDVIRPPRNLYVNRNWNPTRSKYAFLTYLRNGYVIGYTDMEFARQSYDNVADIAGQALIAIKCSYAGILQTFFNLGNALALPSISLQDTIKDYENLNLAWDEVRISCYADTAILARLYHLNYDSCSPDRDDQRKPSPIPSPPSPVSPGTPIADLSRPYSNDSITSPFPSDSLVDPNALPNQGQRCVKYVVNVSAFDITLNRVVFNALPLYGEVTRWRSVVLPDEPPIGRVRTEIQVESRGRHDNGGQCQNNYVWTRAFGQTGQTGFREVQITLDPA